LQLLSWWAAIFILALAIKSDRIAMQWGFDGKPTWYAPKFVGLWFTVALALAVRLLIGDASTYVPERVRAAELGLLMFSIIVAAVHLLIIRDCRTRKLKQFQLPWPFRHCEEAKLTKHPVRMSRSFASLWIASLAACNEVVGMQTTEANKRGWQEAVRHDDRVTAGESEASRSILLQEVLRIEQPIKE
jgi:hypothetical protein